MTSVYKSVCIVAGLAFAGTSIASDTNSATSFSEAMLGGEYHLNLRYRFEFVDQENLKDANASTLKTRLNFKSKPYYGLTTFLEMDNNSIVGDDDYNSTQNGKSEYAVVADPDYTEINQANLTYQSDFDTSFKYGRQRILLDNQRFVGGVGWRQNEQTYDGFSVANTSFTDTTLFYAHVYNVNNIFGNNVGEVEHNLINFNTRALPVGSLSVYGYLLEDISDTYGARLSGAQPVSSVKATYAVEYAMQSENGEASAYDANYYLFEVGAKTETFSALVGYEVQESDDGVKAFRTPLGTNHKFGGWADKFLATPANGLEDLYFNLSTKVAGVKLAAVYHVFTANEGGDDYGSELDLLAVKKFMKNYAVMLKYANYSADGFATDTQKLWLQVTANF